MIVKYCTINGADDNTDIGELIRLSVEYPFIEWGILADGKEEGTNRFPSKAWIEEFDAKMPSNTYKSLQLSCTRMSDVESNIHNILHNYDIKNFQRVLFSFDLLTMPYAVLARAIAWARSSPQTQFITAHNFINKSVWKMFAGAGLNNHAVLFDASNLTGFTPTKWPNPIPGVPYGYCGGINPQNVEEHLQTLSGIIQDGITWIDMATGVRDNDDRLDVTKVDQVALFTSKYTLY